MLPPLKPVIADDFFHILFCLPGAVVRTISERYHRYDPRRCRNMQQNLYINPLVITYDYDFDEIQHKGSIFPSTEMDSGLIGDYHKLMKSADVISNNMNPRTTYNGNADMTDVVSTIHDMQVQWLVAADRDTNNYQPETSIPIGEMQYDKRMPQFHLYLNTFLHK